MQQLCRRGGGGRMAGPFLQRDSVVRVCLSSTRGPQLGDRATEMQPWRSLQQGGRFSGSEDLQSVGRFIIKV